jgi:hypothetical protein
LLATGFIKLVEEATWLSPIVVMPKKNGKLKICVDFGKLNVVTKKDPYSLVDAQSSGSFSTFLHSLQVHTRFFKVIQMDMVVTFFKKINYNI